MADLETRKSAQLGWEVAREFEVGGQKQWGVRSKGYFKPESEGFLVRMAEYAPNYIEPAHSHTAAEVIFVLDGELEISGNKYGPGDALRINANHAYGPLKAGPNGLRFLLMRADSARYVPATKA